MSQPSLQGAKVILSSCFYNSKKSLPREWIELSYQLFKLPGKKQAIISLRRSNFNLWGLKNQIFEPIVNNLPQITPPTLIFSGKQDRVILVKHAYLGFKLLPHSRLHIFNYCRHWAQVEYELEFNQLTLEFLHTA
ncbi:putative hydrolase [Chondrocystis sp. NIES-4102]|nr:putative hydrolase [Chondrocystis sp. NIES-4102]